MEFLTGFMMEHQSDARNDFYNPFHLWNCPFESLKKMLIKWTKPNQDWTEPSVLSTLVHHSAEPCMRRRVQLSSACGPALPNFWRRARAHVWAPSSANWGISSTTSLAACSQLENHFLVDTHKNFSCFLLCQGKQAENLTKSLVVIPEKSAGLQSV